MKRNLQRTTLEMVAYREGISEEEVRFEIMQAIRMGVMSVNPSARAFWSQFSYEAGLPTPEEVLEKMREMVTQTSGITKKSR